MICPPDFTYPLEKWATAHVAARGIATVVTERRAVVQGGGCAGFWPLALAQYFGHVYTFEPAPTNFQCLQLNIAAAPNISAFPCALGDTQASVGMTRTKAQAGLWRVEGEGTIPMVTLDGVLGDVAIDALVLDVEGSELQAWHGAGRLIAAHRPLLWFEYLHQTAAIDAFLAAHGYTPPACGLGGDRYSIHASRVAN
jgi:FkbM family methyltransferase